jgi:solute carrier family 35 protein E3
MISVSVNFSTFLVIGKTSAVTYQVLGHLKTCLILALGYLVLNNPFSWRNVSGILVALSGMGLYSHACILESQQKAQDNTATSSQVLFMVYQNPYGFPCTDALKCNLLGSQVLTM